MNKLQKGLRALRLIAKHPYLLNHVLESEDVYHEAFVRQYGLPDGLPLLRLEELSPDLEVTVSPYAYLSGATMPIDIALLRVLARRQHAQTYFEIGTWRGESVANVADEVPECVTLNLPREEIVALSGSERYADAHAFFSRHLSNVTHLHGNSQTFDFTPHLGRYDLVFVDGDDAFRHVFHHAAEDHAVLWSVLAAIWEGTPAEKRPHLYHVANTMCAVYLPESLPVGTLIPHATPDHFYQVTLKSIPL